MGSDTVVQNENAVFSKDDFLGQDDLETRDIIMDKFGFKPKPGHKEAIVRIRLMDGHGRDSFEALISSLTEQKDGKFVIKSMKDVKVTLLSLCVVDGKNDLMFTQEELSQINSKNSAAIDHLFKECQDLNKLTDDDVDDMVKNFELDLNADNGSH